MPLQMSKKPTRLPSIALPLGDILNGLRPSLLLIVVSAIAAFSDRRETPDGGAVLRRLPCLALVLVELIDLLKRKVLGLVDLHISVRSQFLIQAAWARLTKKKTKTTAIQQNEPQIQNTLDCSGLRPPSRYGVMNESSQLKNQLAAVVIDRPLARIFRGKISPSGKGQLESWWGLKGATYQ